MLTVKMLCPVSLSIKCCRILLNAILDCMFTGATHQKFRPGAAKLPIACSYNQMIPLTVLPDLVEASISDSRAGSNIAACCLGYNGGRRYTSSCANSLIAIATNPTTNAARSVPPVRPHSRAQPRPKSPTLPQHQPPQSHHNGSNIAASKSPSRRRRNSTALKTGARDNTDTPRDASACPAAATSSSAPARTLATILMLTGATLNSTNPSPKHAGHKHCNSKSPGAPPTAKYPSPPHVEHNSTPAILAPQPRSQKVYRWTPRPAETQHT